MSSSLPEALQPFADPTIASRTLAVLTVTAAAGATLLIAGLRRPQAADTMTAGLLPVARDGYAYLLAALATRFTVQQHRSRLQIAALLVIVAAVEAARLRPGGVPRRGATWLAGSAAVCFGVIAAKWALEPGALTDALIQLRPGVAE